MAVSWADQALGDVVSGQRPIDICEAPDADPELPPVPESDRADQCGRPRSRARWAAKILVPAAIVAGTIYAFAGWSDEFADTWALIGSIRPTWVGAAVAAEAVCFLMLGLMLRTLGGPRPNIRRLAPLRLALVLFGLGSSLPAAPAEGLVMAETALRRRRLARRRSLVVLGAGVGFSDAGLYTLAGVNALLVATVLQVHFGSRLLFAAAGGGLLLVLAGAGWLCSRRKFAEWIAVALGRLARPLHPNSTADRRARGGAWHDALAHVVSGPRAWGMLLAFAAIAWSADALCLRFSLLALGAHISLSALLVAYTAGAISSQIPGVPAGLGVVETVTPFFLHVAGVALPAALGAVVVYRLVATVLPALAGVGALFSMGVGVDSGPEREKVRQTSA